MTELKKEVELKAPADAMLRIAAPFSVLFPYMRGQKDMFLYDHMNSNVTFHRRDQGAVERFTSPKTGIGLPPILNTIHMMMRGQTSAVHLKNIDALMCQLHTMVVRVERSDMRDYAKELESLREYATTDALKKLLDAHIARVSENAVLFDYSLGEKAELFREGMELHVALRKTLPNELSEAQKKIFDKVDGIRSTIFGDLPSDFQTIDKLRLTLKDVEGKPVELLVPNKSEEWAGSTLAGFIYCGSAGKDGFLDTGKVPASWRDMAVATIGQGKAIADNFMQAANYVRGALKSARYSDAETEAMMCASGFNVEPGRWTQLYHITAENLADAAMQDYVIRQSAGLVGDGPPLVSLQDVLDSFNAGLPDDMQLSTPAIEDLVPVTKRDYHGILGALKTYLQGKDALVEYPADEIIKLQLKLCPPATGEGNAVNYDEAPSVRELAAIKQLLDSIHAAVEKAPIDTDQLNVKMDKINRLFGLADKGFEKQRSGDAIAL